MPKQRVAILGGGMAALSAAYQLSLTPELRDAYGVTVYTLGWRLGGKCATGRDRLGRICEHGLHFWFGCYENSFAMLREVYAAWRPPVDCKVRGWNEALRPQDFTPLGAVDAGKPAYWPLTWPLMGGTPGDGGLYPKLWEIVEGLVGVLEDVIENSEELRSLVLDGRLVDPNDVAVGAARPASIAGVPPYGLAEVATAARQWIRRALADVERLTEEALGPIRRLLAALRDHRAGGPTTDPASELLHIGAAFTIGVFEDVFLERKTYEQLCDVDFRDWLTGHGADPDVLRTSTFLRAFYDTVMQYEDGDPKRPSMAASAAIVTLVRLGCTTKGAMMWELQAGMGEVIVAPIYEVLRDRGVRFMFFRRVDRLELSRDHARVERIHLARQADLIGSEYLPTISLKGLVCWPSEPDWDQLKDGGRLRAAGVNFESHWCNWPPAGVETLELGEHFDQVVLAIPLGVFKRLNAESSLADELIAANPGFKAMTEHIGLIPTMATQIWCDLDLRALGWEVEKPAAVGGPEPLSVWADMSQSLPFEPWSGAAQPGSVQYFCGPLSTKLYAQPSTDCAVPEQAANAAHDTAVTWLERYARTFLPATTDAKGRIDWRFLHASPGAVGLARFDEQFWRANVDPSECCPGSFAGSTQYRLPADGSGFPNLFLAGCWVRTGLDTTCVESAIMAGMQAARAISGSPKVVWGEGLVFHPHGRRVQGADMSDTQATLPKYISFRGHGEASVPVPITASNATLYAFAFATDRARIQGFVDKTLNQTAPGKFEYLVLGSHVLLCYMHCEHCVSPANIGWQGDHETAFFVPLMEKPQDGSVPVKLVIWVPYLFIDSPFGLLTGRDVWGFNKTYGTTAMPMNPTDRAEFVSETDISPLLSNKTKVEWTTLLRLARDGSLGPLSSTWSGKNDVLTAIGQNLGPWTITWKDGAELALDFLKLCHEGEVPFINLKQFRDATDSECACLSQLVECDIDPTQLLGAGLLPDGFDLAITPCQSHPIADDLGLLNQNPEGTFPAIFGFWVKMNWKAPAGTIVFEAP
jgi:uncharacterized protein with NAD-binding domain and iron-sulfur cluster